MIDPVLFSIFGFDIRWYGVAYMIGFLVGYFFIMKYYERFGYEKEFAEDLFFYAMVLMVLGGRVFYILFYNFNYFLSNPFSILAVWEGGMSIHGGFFFLIVTCYYYGKKTKTSMLNLLDLLAIPAALMLGFGRLANFVNQELVGKVTSSKIGIVFPKFDNQTRVPYQLFAGLKNVLLFQILYFIFIFRKVKVGVITGLFFSIYNFGRFILDFWREPTVAIGFLSMGQILCLVFGTYGLIVLWYSLKYNKTREELIKKKANKKKSKK